jgi:hypothetical protein
MKRTIFRLTLALPLTVMLWLPASAYLQSLGATEANTALDGTRLTYYPRPTFSQCQTDCANNANCKGFTWIQAGTYNANDAAMCYLLSAVTGRYSARGHYSAVKAATGGGTISAYSLKGFWQWHACNDEFGMLIGIEPKSDTTFEGGFENGNGMIKNGRVNGDQITFTRVIYGDQVQHYSGRLVNEGGRLKMTNGVWTGAHQEKCAGRNNWRAEKR